jgi:integrase
MALTDTKIRNAKAEGKTRKLYDTDGLYLEVSPKGHKWWRLKYRHNGTEKRLSLGVYPEVGLAAARERRNEKRKLIANGVDPSAQRKQEKAERLAGSVNTFEKIGKEWWSKFSDAWVPAHRGRKLRLLENDVFAFIGNRPVKEIKPGELLEVLQRIEARGAIETAHRTLSYIRSIFSYAIASDRLTLNPASELKKALAPVEEKHFPAIIDPQEFAGVLRGIESYRGTLVVRCALRLAPLVFLRPGELRRAEWAEFDLDNARWNVPGARMKMGEDHVIPLSRQALAILRELQPLTGKDKYVFPSARSGKGRPMSDNAILMALRSMGITKEQMVGHSFRASARTMLDEILHFRTDLIEAQLSHAVRDPNGRSYNRTSFLPERSAMMQAWSDYCDSLKAAKLIQFPAAASA